jgi:hypothetical protein
MSTFGRPRIALAAACLALAASAVGASAASATITPTNDADGLAQAIVADAGALAPPSALTGTPLALDAVFPNATSDQALAGFPTNGSTYAILTSGDPQLADHLNEAEDDGVDTWGNEADPEHLRGDTDNDVSVLAVNVNVPAGANCLALDYRFLSDEFPEFVGSQFNDAFIAEVDQSTWTTSDTAVSAPNDFATDTSEEGVTVNGVGPVAVSPEESAGTIYDAATGLVTTKTPITPGAHTVFLSIFDQKDHIYDSAAFVDNLRFGSEDPSTCRPPFVADVPPPPPPPPGPPAPPSNTFSIPGSSIKFNNGSTVVTVVVPGPGTVSAGQASGAAAARLGVAKSKALVKSAKKVATKAGPVKLTIKPTKAGKKVLKKKKKLTVPMKFTFKPTGGTAKSTVKKVTIKLKKKH